MTSSYLANKIISIIALNVFFPIQTEQKYCWLRKFSLLHFSCSTVTLQFLCLCVHACLCGTFSFMKSAVSIKGVWSSSTTGLAGGRQRCLFAPPPTGRLSGGKWCVIQCRACGPTQDISPLIAAWSPRRDPRGHVWDGQVVMDSGCRLLRMQIPFEFQTIFPCRVGNRKDYMC